MDKVYPHVETERVGAVLIVRLANEATRNSLSREMRYSLREIVRAISDDQSVRAVYLTGKGRDFCSGGDLRMLKYASTPWAVHRRFRHASSLLVPLMSLDKPVVCGIRGLAIGGGVGLGLVADQLIVGQSAEFQPGFFRLGAVPDVLTLFTLPRLVGLAHTRNFLYGEPWKAQKLVDLGIATKVVPDEMVDEEGMRLATRLANGPAEVMGFAKQLLLKSFESSLSEIMDMEGLGQVLAMSSPEFQEGLNAFLEGRRPNFPLAAERRSVGDGMTPPDE